MSGLGATVALAIVMGWVVFALAGIALTPPLSAGLAVLAGAAAIVLRDTLPLNALVAVLAPFGIMLPALAARHVAAKLGLPVPGFSTFELAAFLVLYVLFLCTAFGVIPVDLYRFGYAPWPVAAMVLTVCAYGFATGNWFLAGVAVVGQFAWVMGWGSSNWFDYMLHVLLVPVAAIVLIGRLF